MANGVLTGEVDGESFAEWNGGGVNHNNTQAAIVTTGRSILTMRYGELGEEAIVESSNYV